MRHIKANGWSWAEIPSSISLMFALPFRMSATSILQFHRWSFQLLPSELGKVCITSSPWLSLSFYGLLLSIRKKLRHSPSVFSSLFVPLCFHLCPSFGWIPTSTSHQVLNLMAPCHTVSDLIRFFFIVIKTSYFQYSLCHSAPAALHFNSLWVHVFVEISM